MPQFPHPQPHPSPRVAVLHAELKQLAQLDASAVLDASWQKLLHELG
jgi:hypothetical protein